MAATDRSTLYLSLLLSVCATIAVSKSSEIVNVDVYYESMCPDSLKFFFDQLEPSYDSVADNIKLTLIPYGNAKTHGEVGEYKFTCQHGPEECRGNTIQACAIQILNNTKTSIQFINCAFKQSRQEDSIEVCIKSPDVQKKVLQCADGVMGNQLLYKMGKLTNSLQPRHTFIPWTTFNGKGSNELNSKTLRNFVGVLCEFYKTEVPEPCKTHKRKLRNFYRRLVGL